MLDDKKAWTYKAMSFDDKVSWVNQFNEYLKAYHNAVEVKDINSATKALDNLEKFVNSVGMTFTSGTMNNITKAREAMFNYQSNLDTENSINRAIVSNQLNYKYRGTNS
jgi:hypothetical protein